MEGKKSLFVCHTLTHGTDLRRTPPQLGHSGAVEPKWPTGIVRPLWGHNTTGPGNSAIYIYPELKYFRKSLITQLRHRLTYFGTRLNEEYGHFLIPMCFGGLGKVGSTIKNRTPIYWFCSLLLFGNIVDTWSIGQFASRSELILIVFSVNGQLHRFLVVDSLTPQPPCLLWPYICVYIGLF